MKNKLFIFLSLLVFGGLLFSSCKSTRSVMKKPIKEYGFDYLYNKMLENQVDFDYLSAKFNVVYYNGKKKTDLRGQFRIRKDSLIWITLSPALGIEAARISMSDDSIKFINRLNKTYFKGEYSFIDSILNTTLDYYILEAMILGNELTQYDINKFKASIDGGLYRITIQERRKIKKYLKSGEVDSKVLVQNIWLDPETFKIKRVVLKELGDENKRLQIIYAQYHDVDGLLLPEVMQIKISAGTTILINLSFGKTVINQPLRFPFTIPKKYKKLEMNTH
jgi:outer membrane lipoprotein-sorting protein